MAARVSVCVLNWENPELTASCLEAVLSLPETLAGEIELDVVCIDNGSRDDSLARLQDFAAHSHHCVHLLANEFNLGYAGGNNAGIQFALDRLHPDYVWILNNDTLPQPGSLSLLVTEAEREPQKEIWGSTLLEADGQTIQCAGGYYYYPCLSTYKGALAGRGRDELAQLSLKKPVDYISGAAMFVPASTFVNVGLLNAEYFLFFEELDLARRVGGRAHLGWCKASLVIHVGGRSMRKDGAGSVSPTAEYHSNVSALKFTRRYYPHCLVVMAVFRLCAKTAKYILTGRPKLLKPLYASFRDYVLKRPESMDEEPT